VSRRWVAAVASVIVVGGLVQTEGVANVAAPRPTADVRAATTGDAPSSRPANLASIQRRIANLERKVRTYQRTMNRMNRWLACIRHVRVDQIGDVRHRWGFLYDERDGTGLDTRTALVRHKGKRRPDLVMLKRVRNRKCLSRPTDPNGTGADARILAPPTGTGPLGHSAAAPADRALPRNISGLERRLNRLEKRVNRVESAADRFDQWESCLSWLPVTEYGHEDQNLGYLVDDAGGARHLAALDIDRSEWDDPDYQVLAFVGRDRPFRKRECENEPGESVDRQALKRRTPVADPRTSAPNGYQERTSARAGYQERLSDLRDGVNNAAEDVEDLFEPVFEFVTFDECMFTLGVQQRPGYRYRTAAGIQTHKSALSFDMTGLKLPDFDVMAFPGEEPPQIECNEDAGGQNTDE
jgi:hypothetical protein